MKENNILIHTCCAICSGYPIKYLRELGYVPIAYFFNPNIYPDAEYQKRLEAQKILCKALDCELIVEDYVPDSYLQSIDDLITPHPNPTSRKRYSIVPSAESQGARGFCDNSSNTLTVSRYEFYNKEMAGFENYPEGSERCRKCFEIRLLKTAQKAKELKIGNFTTTLSISPHKDFNVIQEIGKSLADCYKIDFADINFKKQDGFVKTNKIAQELNLYRQNYCGCRIDAKMQRGKDV